MAKESKLNDLIHTALNYARLAPSSHNTQPWRVQVAGGRITVGYDPARHLKVGDPERRELFMSLGCFIENFILAGAALGLDTDYGYLGDRAGAVARLDVKEASARPPARQWPELIKNRRSDRRQFKQQPLNASRLAALRKLKLNQASVKICDAPADINFLGNMTLEATVELMTPAAFRTELSAWIRHNWTKRPDGMPGYTQGMPGPVSLIGHRVVRHLSATAKDQAKKDSQRVRQAAAVCLVLTDENQPRGWIDAGRLLQLVWLSAEEYGISASAISPAVISRATSARITAKLELKAMPVGLLRLGYALGGLPKAAPRLELEAIIAT